MHKVERDICCRYLDSLIALLETGARDAAGMGKALDALARDAARAGASQRTLALIRAAREAARSVSRTRVVH